MRILLLLPELPYPPTKGYALMAYQHIRELSARHGIDILTFSSNSTPNDLELLSNYCGKITTVPLPKWNRWLNLFMAVFKKTPFQVAMYESSQMLRITSQLVKSGNYDAVMFQLTRMAQFVTTEFKGRQVLNMIDPVSLSYRRSLAWRPFLKRFIYRWEAKRLHQYEAHISKLVDAVTFACARDAIDYTQEVATCNAQVVPHAVDLNFFIPRKNTLEAKNGPKKIIMTGNMGYPPNIDGACYFATQIFPLIRIREPNAQFEIAGVRPNLKVRRLTKLPGVKVLGRVQSIRDVLWTASVAICPIRLAVGVQTKILEAMACGIPVVTTSAGNHGISGLHGRDLLVADSPGEFAEAVLRLLQGDDWLAFSNASHEFVSRNFSWRRSADALEAALSGLSSSAP